MKYIAFFKRAHGYPPLRGVVIRYPVRANGVGRGEKNDWSSLSSRTLKSQARKVPAGRGTYESIERSIGGCHAQTIEPKKHAHARYIITIYKTHEQNRGKKKNRAHLLFRQSPPPPPHLPPAIRMCRGDRTTSSSSSPPTPHSPSSSSSSSSYINGGEITGAIMITNLLLGRETVHQIITHNWTIMQYNVWGGDDRCNNDYESSPGEGDGSSKLHTQLHFYVIQYLGGRWQVQ